MSASRITFLAAGALALAVLPGRSEAQGRSPDALTGVRSVTTLLERTSPSTLTAGVDTAALRTRAEAAVLRAGLTVVPPAARDSASGVLYLNVFSATNAQRDWHAAHVEVELMQPVTIDRKPDARLYATTWQYEHAQAIIEKLVERLDRRGLIDTSRIGMGGLSFGSEVTMWMAMKTDLLAAAATASPQGSPSGFWQSGIRGRDTAEHYLRGWKAGHPDTHLDSWRRFSPELNVARIKAPLLMQLPEQEIVSVLQFYARMTHSTTPVELYAYPHESHTKVQPRHRYAVYRRNLDWFRYWLQGHVDPDPAQAAQYRRWGELRARRSRSVKGS